MIRTLVILPLALLTGCTVTTYRDGTHSFTRVALGANTQAQTLTVRVLPDVSMDSPFDRR